VPAVLPRRTAFEAIAVGLIDSRLARLEDGGARSRRRVDTAGDLVPNLDQPTVGFPLALAGLDEPLAGLVEIVGDPCGLDLASGGRPFALADRCHRCQLLASRARL